MVNLSGKLVVNLVGKLVVSLNGKLVVSLGGKLVVNIAGISNLYALDLLHQTSMMAENKLSIAFQ